MTPEAGEHTEQVLRELECGDADIQRLRDAKIV
jgi:crotonobetainyl-CoA:carnitine CoA-transferase CaiB-like acyl-CoA transferase